MFTKLLFLPVKTLLELSVEKILLFLHGQGMPQVYNKNIVQHNELVSLCMQFHQMRHLVPPVSHKPRVVSDHVSPYNYVWLILRLVCDSVGSFSCHPFGILSRCMTLGPHSYMELTSFSSLHESNHFLFRFGKSSHLVCSFKSSNYQGFSIMSNHFLINDCFLNGLVTTIVWLQIEIVQEHKRSADCI